MAVRETNPAKSQGAAWSTTAPNTVSNAANTLAKNTIIDDMLMYLGELYQTDERFVEYINRFATWNVAEFFGEAIKVYCCNR